MAMITDESLALKSEAEGLAFAREAFEPAVHAEERAFEYADGC